MALSRRRQLVARFKQLVPWPQGRLRREREKGRSAFSTRQSSTSLCLFPSSRHRPGPTAAVDTGLRRYDEAACLCGILRLNSSISRNCLPAGIALRHIRVIAARIGAIVPSLRGVGLAVIIIAIVGRVIPSIGICERSTEEKPVIVKSIAVEPAIVKSVPVKPAPVKPTKSAAVHPGEASVESTHSAAVEAAKSAPMETPARTPAVRPGIGEMWLAERRRAQQSSCDC
jgi:hypothetical protein